MHLAWLAGMKLFETLGDTKSAGWQAELVGRSVCAQFTLCGHFCCSLIRGGLRAVLASLLPYILGLLWLGLIGAAGLQ
jgi:hypothetical protein